MIVATVIPAFALSNTDEKLAIAVDPNVEMTAVIGVAVVLGDDRLLTAQIDRIEPGGHCAVQDLIGFVVGDIGETVFLGAEQGGQLTVRARHDRYERGL